MSTTGMMLPQSTIYSFPLLTTVVYNYSQVVTQVAPLSDTSMPVVVDQSLQIKEPKKISEVSRNNYNLLNRYAFNLDDMVTERGVVQTVEHQQPVLQREDQGPDSPAIMNWRSLTPDQRREKLTKTASEAKTSKTSTGYSNSDLKEIINAVGAKKGGSKKELAQRLLSYIGSNI